MRRVWRRLGWASLFAYIVVPQLAILMLIGYGVAWWAGAFAAVAWGVAVLVALHTGAPHSEFLSRTFGTAGWDPTDYKQWTRYDIVRSLVIGPVGGVLAAVALGVALVLGAPVLVAYLVGLVAGFGGWLVGGWLWIRAEDARTRAEEADNSG
jgi:hypothetical protein